MARVLNMANVRKSQLSMMRFLHSNKTPNIIEEYDALYIIEEYDALLI
jgi:hypothetical protein